MSSHNPNMSDQITRGCVPRLVGGENIANPVVQVTSIKKIEPAGNGNNLNGPDRYRVLLSDGDHIVQGMLATQKNELVISGQLIENSVVRLLDFLCNDVKGRKILIILGVDILQQHAQKMGNPINFESGAVGGAPVDVKPAPSAAYGQQQQPQQQQQQYQAPAQQSNPYMAGGQQQQQQQNQGYRPPQQQQQQQQFGGGAAVARDAGNQNFLPIRALNQYQNRWVIKARVTSKGEVRHWDKGPTNQGKLFSVDLMDAEGVEIRATFFKEAVDEWEQVLQINNVYTFGNGRVKIANKQFSAIANDYELNFGRDSQVTHVAEDNSIKLITLEPKPIATFADMAPDSLVDVLGVAQSISEIQEFTSKAGKPFVKCEAVIVDRSNASVKVTFWSTKAHELKAAVTEAFPILGLRKCKLSDYGGRTLSAGGQTQVMINPDLPEAGQLRTWFDSGGANSGVKEMSSQGGMGQPKAINERHTLDSITTMGLGRGEKPDFVEVKASVMFIKQDNMWYASCPEEGMQKKVVQQPDGSWFCEATNQSYPNCEYRYIASMKIGDHTDSTWATGFNEVAVKLLGKTADEMFNLRNENEQAFTQVVESASFKQYVFKLRVKEEIVMDAPRMKKSIVGFTPVNFPAECRQLIEAIKTADP